MHLKKTAYYHKRWFRRSRSYWRSLQPGAISSGIIGSSTVGSALRTPLCRPSQRFDRAIDRLHYEVYPRPENQVSESMSTAQAGILLWLRCALGWHEDRLAHRCKILPRRHKRLAPTYKQQSGVASSTCDPHQPWPWPVLVGISVEAGRNRFLVLAIAKLVFWISPG